MPLIVSHPRYSNQELKSLAITGVHLIGESLVCALSDGQWLSVPLSISPALKAATPAVRSQWHLIDGRRVLVWRSSSLRLQLTLRAIADDSQTIVVKPLWSPPETA